MGFINPRSLVRSQFPLFLLLICIFNEMNETKKNNKKEEKIVRIDIRKMPTRKAIGVPSIVMTVILSLLSLLE